VSGCEKTGAFEAMPCANVMRASSAGGSSAHLHTSNDDGCEPDDDEMDVCLFALGVLAVQKVDSVCKQTVGSNNGAMTFRCFAVIQIILSVP